MKNPLELVKSQNGRHQVVATELDPSQGETDKGMGLLFDLWARMTEDEKFRTLEYLAAKIDKEDN